MNSKIKPNFQDLIKFFAILSMVIDHASLFLFPSDWGRVLGRFAAPVFLFFVGYNYYKKKSLGSRYNFFLPGYRKIVLLGLLCQVLLYILVPEFGILNILLSISIGLTILDLMANFKIDEPFQFLLMALLFPIFFVSFDYGTMGTYFILLGYFAHHGRDRLMYRIEVLVGLGWIFSLTLLLMNFSIIQNIVTFMMFVAIGIILIFTNFEKTISGRVFLLSRYAIDIFVIHFMFFAIIYGYFSLAY